MVEVLLAAVAGAGFTVVALLGGARVSVSSQLRGAAVGVAGGILLGIAFAELFPEALERAGHESAVTGFVAGFLALFIVETLTKGHTHHEHAHDDRQLARHAPIPFIVGLGLHNLADGFAIGTTTELSEAAGTAVAAGILVHQLPVGVSFGAVLLALESPRATVVRTAVALGVLIPIGAAVTVALPSLSALALGTLLAAAGGALVYIGAGHLLPEAQSERTTPVVASIFPVALVLTTVLFVTVLPHE